jgi:hypothetical protein
MKTYKLSETTANKLVNLLGSAGASAGSVSNGQKSRRIQGGSAAVSTRHPFTVKIRKNESNIWQWRVEGVQPPPDPWNQYYIAGSIYSYNMWLLNMPAIDWQPVTGGMGSYQYTCTIYVKSVIDGNNYPSTVNTFEAHAGDDDVYSNGGRPATVYTPLATLISPDSGDTWEIYDPINDHVRLGWIAAFHKQYVDPS